MSEFIGEAIQGRLFSDRRLSVFKVAICCLALAAPAPCTALRGRLRPLAPSAASSLLCPLRQRKQREHATFPGADRVLPIPDVFPGRLFCPALADKVKTAYALSHTNRLALPSRTVLLAAFLSNPDSTSSGSYRSARAPSSAADSGNQCIRVDLFQHTVRHSVSLTSLVRPSKANPGPLANRFAWLQTCTCLGSCMLRSAWTCCAPHRSWRSSQFIRLHALNTVAVPELPSLTVEGVIMIGMRPYHPVLRACPQLSSLPFGKKNAANNCCSVL